MPLMIQTTYHRCIQFYRENKMLWFLINLVLLLLLYPYLGNNTIGLAILSGINILILANAINATKYFHHSEIVAVILWILAVVGQTSFIISQEEWFLLIYFIAIGLFYLLTIIELLIAIFNQKIVSNEMFYSVVNIYILIGLTRGALYMIIRIMSPWSFNLEWTHDQPRWTLLYYSFATLTTIGYGDVVPLTPKVRSLAMIEWIIGVMYNAILIAKLVAMNNSYLYHKHTHHSPYKESIENKREVHIKET